MKQIKHIAFAVLAISMLGACTRTIDVKIGVVAPMSGPLGTYGKDMAQGAQVAMDELNAEAFRISGKHANFTLVIEDDKADKAVGVAAAKRLVDANVNAVFGHFNSGVSIEAAPIYAKANIPQMSVSTNPKYTQLGFRTTFRITANDIFQGAALGQLITDKLKAKSVFMVDDKTLFGAGLAAEVRKKIVAASVTLNSESMDAKSKPEEYAAVVGKIKESNTDVVFFGGDEGVGLPLLKALRESGSNALFVVGDAMCDASFIKAVDAVSKGAANQNFYCTIAGVPPSWLSAGISFTQMYKKKYGVAPGSYATLAYTGVHVFAQAMQEAKSIKPGDYMPVLAKGSFDGKIQGMVEFDERGDVKDGTVVIFESINGKLVEKRNLL